MGAGCAVLEPADVQGSCFELDLIPSQVDHLSGPQAMPKSQERHQSVAVTFAIILGRFDQLLDLINGQVLPGP
jgi:hypothetical protein